MNTEPRLTLDPDSITLLRLGAQADITGHLVKETLTRARRRESRGHRQTSPDTSTKEIFIGEIRANNDQTVSYLTFNTLVSAIPFRMSLSNEITDQLLQYENKGSL